MKYSWKYMHRWKDYVRCSWAKDQHYVVLKLRPSMTTTVQQVEKSLGRSQPATAQHLPIHSNFTTPSQVGNFSKHELHYLDLPSMSAGWSSLNGRTRQSAKEHKRVIQSAKSNSTLWKTQQSSNRKICVSETESVRKIKIDWCYV